MARPNCGRGADAAGHPIAVARNALMESSRRNAEAMTAMGMVGRIAQRWREANRSYIVGHRPSQRCGRRPWRRSQKGLRMLLPSSLLAVGAALVIYQISTPGIIIAGSILGGRALAPVDLAIANWRGFIGARQSWHRLSRLLPLPPRSPSRCRCNRHTFADVRMRRSGRRNKKDRLKTQFPAPRRQGTRVIGPTASGKSSLARMLVGVWTPLRGTVRLTAPRSINGRRRRSVAMSATAAGCGIVSRHCGANISRFEDPPDPEAVLAAAQAAGVHDLIVNLPDGYETNVGNHGSALSAARRNAIALARALYRDPFLVVLDEPISNLDAEGDEALTRAILGLRARAARSWWWSRIARAPSPASMISW